MHCIDKIFDTCYFVNFNFYITFKLLTYKYFKQLSRFVGYRKIFKRNCQWPYNFKLL